VNTYSVLAVLQICTCACLGQASTNAVKKVRPQTNAEPRELALREIPLNQLQLTNTVGERFESYLNNRLDKLSTRKVHPFNTMTRLLTADSYEQFDERAAGIGQGLVRQSLQQALRETAKDIPFVYSTINRDTFFARLFRDSLGNTAEEEFKAAQISYSTNELEGWEQISGLTDSSTNGMTRWDTFKDHIHPRYGIRLNYAYAAFTVGRYVDKPVLFADIRYHYGNISLADPYETDVESLISMPWGNKTLCTVGLIQTINPPDWDRRWSFKISQKIDGGRVFVGVTVREKPTQDLVRYIWGFERPW
jgi:hypothetical protein